MKEFVVLRKNIGNNNEPRVVLQFCHHLFFNYHGMIFGFCEPPIVSHGVVQSELWMISLTWTQILKGSNNVG